MSRNKKIHDVAVRKLTIRKNTKGAERISLEWKRITASFSGIGRLRYRNWGRVCSCSQLDSGEEVPGLA
ncbi:hypothetical protein C9422_21030 [Pseudomonas sp. B1(2018)]|nr:hypothetical protein C9422_21030 [Pseudomonas sp. B1(2018)]